MNDLTAKLRRDLAAKIRSPYWAAAVEAVPRERFVGDDVYVQDAAGWVPVHRSQMSDADWLEVVYADDTLVTQVSGVMAAADADAPTIERPTSSSTLPSLVVHMLDVAGIRKGDRVLEIGTGTGYSTALMCHVLGADAVTSVEVDAEVARRAEAAIVAAGYVPTLLIGDGLRGFDGNAPYDRLIATCAVRRIPESWLQQVRPGGTITTPMLGWTGGAALAHLVVADDGTARGSFLPEPVFFMPARAHAAPPLDAMQFGGGEVSTTATDPALLNDDTGLLVAQLAVPRAQRAWAGEILALHDVESGSHADVRPSRPSGWEVHQYGPHRLWDEVERALSTWLAAGKPDMAAFTLTATPERQWVRFGVSSPVAWDLPA